MQINSLSNIVDKVIDIQMQAPLLLSDLFVLHINKLHEEGVNWLEVLDIVMVVTALNKDKELATSYSIYHLKRWICLQIGIAYVALLSVYYRKYVTPVKPLTDVYLYPTLCSTICNLMYIDNK